MNVRVEFKDNAVSFTFGKPGYEKLVVFTNKGNSSYHNDVVVEQFAIALLANGDYDKSEEFKEKLGKL